MADLIRDAITFAGPRARMDEALRELVATQEPDGYLGTYPANRRFGLYQGADRDVWPTSTTGS